MHVFAALLALTAVAAPVPFPRPDAGLIWVHDRPAGRLLGFRPDGRQARDVPLPKGAPFLGLTPDGQRVVTAGGPAGGKTYRLRPLVGDGPSADLGLDYLPADQPPLWARDGKRVLRVRGRSGGRVAGLEYAAFDLSSKKGEEIDVPIGRRVVGWAADDERLVLLRDNPIEDVTLWLLRPGERPTPLTSDGLPFRPSQVRAALGRPLLAPGYTDVPGSKHWYHALYAIDAASGRAATLIHEPGQGWTDAEWSPDTARLCMLWGYVKDESRADGWDERRLTVAKADGTGRVTVTLRDKAKGQDPYAVSLVGWYSSPRR